MSRSPAGHAGPAKSVAADLASRFDLMTYAEDPKALVRLGSVSRCEVVAPIDTWISERLLQRVRHLALAFELPLLSRLPAGTGRWVYPDEQLDALADELVLVVERVDDPALASALASLNPLFHRRGGRRGEWHLMVEVG